jgi:hypothetical protein
MNIFILVDRSSSMSTHFLGAYSYAQVVSDALKTVVAKHDPSDLTNFGLGVFPSPECLDKDTDSPDMCTAAQGPENPIVDIQLDTYAEIDAALDAVGNCGGTPMCQSLVWALSYLTNDLTSPLDQLPTSVVLITDGEPNCNPALDPATCTCTQPICAVGEQCLDDQCTNTAAAQLYAAGYPVYVIGVGNDMTELEEVLNNIAVSGGTTGYHPATDQQSADDALEDVIGSSMSCRFTVDWSTVDPGGTLGIENACDHVQAYGYTDSMQPELRQEIPYSWDCSDPAAWHWKDDPGGLTVELGQCTEIELCPDTCTAFKDGNYWQMDALFGCPQ